MEEVLMTYALPIAAAILCAIQAIRAKRLLRAALWLAGVSALLSIAFYQFGASQVAVIELSVGAGLVTVLFVFAISIAGEEVIPTKPVVPKPLAWLLVLVAIVLIGWFILPLGPRASAAAETPFSAMFWQTRGLDVLIQVMLIFAGVLGLLGLLAEAKAPLDQPFAEEFAAERDLELQALEAHTMDAAVETSETWEQPS
jgi:uncharacterized MnhB-related membrane protein